MSETIEVFLPLGFRSVPSLSPWLNGRSAWAKKWRSVSGAPQERQPTARWCLFLPADQRQSQQATAHQDQRHPAIR